MPPNNGTFAPVGRFLYYSMGSGQPVDTEALERAAEEALATERWRQDLATWADETRPTVVAESRALVSVELGALDDHELAAHLRETAAHFQRWAPEHFALMSVQACAGGSFIEAASAWGLDPAEVFEALAGEARATASGDALLRRIATGLQAAGVDQVASLDEVVATGGDAAAALDELVVDYGWRCLGHDLTPTLAEQPDAIVAMVNGALTVAGPRAAPKPERLEALRSRIPVEEHERFDELSEVARVAYGFNDDNTVVLFSMPLGTVRRAVLEAGRRLAARGQVLEASDAFEATADELRELLAHGGPAAEVLAERRVERLEAEHIDPPWAVGDPVPATEPVDLPEATRRLGELRDAWWNAGSGPAAPERAAASVGSEIVRGRALVARDPVDALVRLQPGDILVTDSTNAAWNVVFPVLAAVAVEYGGPMGHAAILAREIGLTAVIGVPGLLDQVQDGDQVEIDPITRTITPLGDPAT
jgi:pyruvate,water dikinase